MTEYDPQFVLETLMNPNSPEMPITSVLHSLRLAHDQIINTEAGKSSRQVSINPEHLLGLTLEILRHRGFNGPSPLALKTLTFKDLLDEYRPSL